MLNEIKTYLQTILFSSFERPTTNLVIFANFSRKLRAWGPKVQYNQNEYMGDLKYIFHMFRIYRLLLSDRLSHTNFNTHTKRIFCIVTISSFKNLVQQIIIETSALDTYNVFIYFYAQRNINLNIKY